MAWFKNLFRSDAATDDPTPAVPQTGQHEPTVLGGAEQIEVVGESHYQDQLRRIAGDGSTRVRLNTTATLLAEAESCSARNRNRSAGTSSSPSSNPTSTRYET